MFDVKKLVESIVSFVNFFVVRIAVACFVAGLLYRMSGRYYFDLVATYASDSPLSEQNFKLYIAKASEYVTDNNVKNAIFVGVLIIGLSLLDILYRSFWKIGDLLPVRMLYNYRYATNRYRPVILQTWRRYAREYDPYAFIQLVEDRASPEVWKLPQYGWGRTLFSYSKSFIVLVLLIYLLTPSAALKINFLLVLYCVAFALICMAVCTAIESARVFGVMSSALSGATQMLANEAKEAPISDAEYQAATKDILKPGELPEWWREDWRGKFSCVRLTVGIPYIVNGRDILQVYRDYSAKLIKRPGRSA
jgi:hypothetical protein